MPNGPYPLTFVRSYNAGLTPSYVAVDPDGNFVYVVSPGSNDVSGFAVSTGGTLNPIGAASAFGGAGPRLLTVRHIGDKTAISLSAGFPPASAPFGTPVNIKGASGTSRNPPSFHWARSPSQSMAPRSRMGPWRWMPPPGFKLVFDASTQYLPVGSNLIQIAYNPGPGFETPTPVQVSVTVTKAATEPDDRSARESPRRTAGHHRRVRPPDRRPLSVRLGDRLGRRSKSPLLPPL